MLRDLLYRARALFAPRRLDRELDDELAFHLEMAVDKHMAAGMSRAEATRRARIDLGGVHQVEQAVRHGRGVALAQDLVQDVRYGMRQLRSTPAFTAVALITLALGIGANTGLFSVVNRILLSPLPYPDPDQLVVISQSKPNFATGSLPYTDFLDLHKDNRTFAAMAVIREFGFSLTGGGTAEQVTAQLVTADLFPLLGVEPVAGRRFVAGEDRVGAAPLVMLGEGLWQRRFGGSRDVIGRSITLSGRAYTVIGVVPGKFDTMLRTGARDVYVPIGQWTNNLLLNRGAGLGIRGIGRLRPGVTIEQAQNDLDRVSAALARTYPDSNKNTRAVLTPLRQWVTGGVRPILLALFGAVGIVLLVACVNVANLTLSRASGRRRELAIRVALGAGRRRLIRQLMTESLLLAAAGGALGLIVASWGVPAALALLPDTLPRSGEVSIDGRVLAFCAAVSIGSGLVFGLVPALRATDHALHGALKDGGRGAGGTRHRAQQLFVVIQMAMVVVLLVAAGLMVRTLTRLWNTDPGFEPDGVTVFGLAFPASRTDDGPEPTRAYLRQLETRIHAVPGVADVAFSAGGLPLIADDQAVFWQDGQPKPASADMSWTLWYVVGPEFRRAFGLRLLSGRFFEPTDDERHPLVVVVDDVFARQYFGDADPIGKVLHLDGYDEPVRVVGVVAHTMQWGLDVDADQELRAQMYLPVMQLRDDSMAPSPGIDVVVRGKPGFRLESLRAALREMDPDHIVVDPRTMDKVIADSLARRRFAMGIFVVLAALALVLSAIGIYGVVSYSVGQRTSEIGIRMALGARRGDVLRLVVGQGVRTALIGTAIGFAAALALTRLIAHLLYGVTSTDPVTFAAVGVVAAGVAFAASYIPARRAARVDPMIALRHD